MIKYLLLVTLRFQPIKRKKNYSLNALLDAIKCWKFIIYPVFSYFGRIQNVLDDCELFSIYMKAISEKNLAFIPIKENSVYREKVHKLRETLREKLLSKIN